MAPEGDWSTGSKELGRGLTESEHDCVDLREVFFKDIWLEFDIVYKADESDYGKGGRETNEREINGDETGYLSWRYEQLRHEYARIYSRLEWLWMVDSRIRHG